MEFSVHYISLSLYKVICISRASISFFSDRSSVPCFWFWIKILIWLFRLRSFTFVDEREPIRMVSISGSETRFSLWFWLFVGFWNGPQEDQRVRLEEVVEGALQEALWPRIADQVRSGQSVFLCFFRLVISLRFEASRSYMFGLCD